jgi:hypothetical protein
VTRAEGPSRLGRWTLTEWPTHPARIARTAERGSAGSSPSSRTHPGMLNRPIQQARRTSTRPSIPSPWLRSEDRRPARRRTGVCARGCRRSAPWPITTADASGAPPGQARCFSMPRRAATRRRSSSQALPQVRNSSETAIGGIGWGSGEPMRAVAEGSLLRVGRGRLEATGMASPGRRARR